MSANASIVAPASSDAEEAVIGALLINPSIWPDIAALLQPADFFTLRYQYIYSAMARLHERNDAIDWLTLQEELRAIGKLSEIGGPAALLNLVNNTPTSIHAEVYARLVQRAAVRRRLLSAADTMKRLALDEEQSTELVLADAERAFNGVVDSFAEQQADHTMSDMVDALLDDMERIREGGRVSTCPTGFRDLDTFLGGGLWRGDVVTLAGRPGMGKTAMLLQIALNAARVGVRVGIHSLEMDSAALVRRLAASETGIDLLKLRTGQLSKAEYALLVEAAGKIGPLPIMVNDEPLQTPQSVFAQARRWQMRRGLDLVVLDYVQILNGMGQFKGGEREREIAFFMRSLKIIARKLAVPIIVAAQLSRAVEARQDKRPLLSDLRESGSIEQDSDIVLFLFREGYYNEACLDPNLLEVIVGKQRNGPTGHVDLTYEPSRQRISDRRGRE